MIQKDGKLTLELYHGTSSLFLDSILKNGLGGINPVTEWNLLELCKEVYILSEKHLKETRLFQISSGSLKRMSEQSCSGFNFQHGDTYVSPSRQTAIRYAINKRYGSEMLTYTIDFLKKLLDLDIDYVKKDLFRKYPKIFGLIEANPSPLLIEIFNVDTEELLTEHGGDPNGHFEYLSELMEGGLDFLEIASQQTNFRLKNCINKEHLRIWMINVQKWSFSNPEYNLYELKIDD